MAKDSPIFKYRIIKYSGLTVLIIMALVFLCFLLEQSILTPFNKIIQKYTPIEFEELRIDSFFIREIVYFGNFLFIITTVVITSVNGRVNNKLVSNTYAIVESIQKVTGVFVFLLVMIEVSNHTNPDNIKDINCFVFFISEMVYILISYAIIEYIIVRRIKLEFTNFILCGFSSEMVNIVNDLRS